MLMASIPSWQIRWQFFTQMIHSLRKIESAANADCIPQASSTHISNHYDIKKKTLLSHQNSHLLNVNFPNQVKKQTPLG